MFRSVVDLQIASNRFVAETTEIPNPSWTADQNALLAAVKRGKQTLKSLHSGIRQDSTGGEQKLGPISKRGDQYLRRIVVVRAHVVLKRARHLPKKYPCVTRLLERKSFSVVTVAVTNRWRALPGRCCARGGSYRAPALAAAA